MNNAKEKSISLIISLSYSVFVLFSWIDLFRLECGYRYSVRFSPAGYYLFLIAFIIIAVVNHIMPVNIKNIKMREFEVMMNPYIFVHCMVCVVMMSYPIVIIELNHLGYDIGVPWSDGNPVAEYIMTRMEYHGYYFYYIR